MYDRAAPRAPGTGPASARRRNRRLTPPSDPYATTPAPPARPRGRARWARVGLAAITLNLGACTARMMPTPVIYRLTGADPFALVAPDRRSAQVEVFYATDRAPRASADGAAPSYGSARAPALRLGLATVRLGAEDAPWDTLVDQTRRDSRPTMHIESIEEFGEMLTPDINAASTPENPTGSAARRFVDAVNTRLAGSHTRDIVVHVPDFNSTFEKPVGRMACIAHMLSRDAVCIAYSWPSWDIPFGYGMQMVRARSSVRKLRELILLLAEHTDAERIHVIAYSNGAQLATDALVQLRLTFSALDRDELRRRLRIGSVVYAAADEDLQHFQGAGLDGLHELARRTVIYTSRGDAGLDLSRIFVSGTPRLGQARQVAPGIGGDVELIDVGLAVDRAGGGDLWAHAYWYRNPWISSDLLLLLRHDLPPERRALIPSTHGPFWTFPSDYPGKATAVAREALAP